MDVGFLLVCLVFSTAGAPLNLIIGAPFNLVTGVGGVLQNDDKATTTFVEVQKQCHPWEYWNSERQSCVCSHSLLETVSCENIPYSLKIFACFCMTYDNSTDELVVGACQLSCQTPKGYYTNITANTSSEINHLMCDSYYREGQLCGSCKKGYSPPVYSYSLSCVRCTDNHWGKYIAVSLLPVTVFYVIVITLRVNAASPLINGLIICLQLLFSPPHLRLYANSKAFVFRPTVDFQLSFLSFYSIWNLDFVRLVYDPFCLQPDMNTLQVLALDYLIAVYPLVLIGFSFLLVLLYDRSAGIIASVFKPFVLFFIKFRRQWNIRNSLVDAFATFLLLSYVKILSVSVDLLLPVVIYHQNGLRFSQLYLFNQGDMPYFENQHFPYACLAIFFLITFNLLPMLLLFIYPCSCFQLCLNRADCRCQSLHIFMDSFQGHFKNGTNKTRDLRFFSGLYLLLRVLVFGSIMLTYQIATSAYTTAIISVVAITVALVRPYKKNIHNVIDAGFLTVTQLFFVTLLPLRFGRFSRMEHGLSAINTVLLILPFLYITMLVVWKTLCCLPECCLQLLQRLKMVRGSLFQRFEYNSL